MGRGLSKLQTWILRRAAEYRRVYYADVLVHFFRWKPNRPLTYATEELISAFSNEKRTGMLPSLERPGDQTFSLESIGESVYRNTMASLSRSCLRLGQRGLVSCLTGRSSRWSAVEITDAGRSWLAAHTKSGKSGKRAFDIVAKREVAQRQARKRSRK